MIILTRIKTLRLFGIIIKRIKKSNFDVKGAQLLSNYLVELKDADLITNDYLEDIDVLFYVTNQCLSVDSTDWVTLSRNELSTPNAFSKMSDLIKELEANSLIKYKIVDTRGIIRFQLTYKDDFNKCILKKIKAKRDRLKIVRPSRFVIATINLLSECTREIVIAVIVLAIVALVK